MVNTIFYCGLISIFVNVAHVHIYARLEIDLHNLQITVTALKQTKPTTILCKILRYVTYFLGWQQKVI